MRKKAWLGPGVDGGDGMDGWDVSVEPREMGIGCTSNLEFIRNYGENEIHGTKWGNLFSDLQIFGAPLDIIDPPSKFSQ